jgi:hypothetical protein
MRFSRVVLCSLAISIVGNQGRASAVQEPTRQTDYSGLGLNTKQLAAVRATERRMDAEDRASFEHLWAEAPSSVKSSGLPKSLWYGLYKWSITMGTVGSCSKFIDTDEVEQLRHAWDSVKGKNAALDGIIQAGDEAFQEGDARGNDPGAPNAQTCAVTLRSLEASDARAIATLAADLAAQPPH